MENQRTTKVSSVSQRKVSQVSYLNKLLCGNSESVLSNCQEHIMGGDEISDVIFFLLSYHSRNVASVIQIARFFDL